MNRPNLERANCYALDVAFEINLGTRDISRLFGKQYSRNPDWHFLAYQEYSEEKKKHHCFLVIHHRTQKASIKKAKLHVDITFAQGRADLMGVERKKMAPALDFLQKHAGLLRKRTSDITARFHYDGDKYNSVPELPSPYIFAAFENTEIVGVRISFRDKALAKRPQASINIEKTPEGNIHQKIDFSYIISDIETGLPSVLALSTAISQKFCRQKS